MYYLLEDKKVLLVLWKWSVIERLDLYLCFDQLQNYPGIENIQNENKNLS